jgi:uncharacterized protein
MAVRCEKVVGNIPASRNRQDTIMLKFTTAAALAAFICITPALADDKLACDDAGMMKVDTMMKEKMGMKINTDMAMKESEMATMSKKEGKMDDCAMHLNMAQDELMKAK